MKSKNPYTFFNKICSRASLLSLDFSFFFTKSEEISNEGYRKAWTNDSIIKELIFLESFELYIIIEEWLKEAIKDQKKIRKLKFSLLKYLSRMLSRPTPLWLFANCTIERIVESTAIELQPNREKCHRQIRFDRNCLVTFFQKTVNKNNIGVYFNRGKNFQKHKLLSHLEYKSFKNNHIFKVTKWCQKLLIPIYIQLIDKKNTVLINLENKYDIFLWMNTIRNRTLINMTFWPKF